MDSYEHCVGCPFHLYECFHGLCAYNVPATVPEKMDSCPCNFSKDSREFADRMARMRNINKRARLYAVRYYSFDSKTEKPQEFYSVEALYKRGDPDHLYMAYVTEHSRIFWLAKLQPPKGEA